MVTPNKIDYSSGKGRQMTTVQTEDYRITHTRQLLALAREQLEAEKADRPGVAGYAERVRLAQVTVDALTERIALFEAHHAQHIERMAQIEALRTRGDAVAEPEAAAAPAPDPAAIAAARRDVQAARDVVAHTQTDRPAWADWHERMEAAHAVLRARQARLAALERAAAELTTR